MTKDELWTGKVYLTGDVTVPLGKTLTISAGTEIVLNDVDKLQTGVDTNLIELNIKGKLTAKGSIRQPIKFQSRSTTTRWTGIVLASSGSGTMAYVQISRAKYGIQSAASFSFTSGTISDCSVAGIYTSGGKAEVTFSVISGNTKYGAALMGGTPYLYRNLFTANGLSTSNYDYGIYIAASATVDHNTVAYNNTAHGIRLSTTSYPTVSNNVVASNGSNGISSTNQRSLSRNLVWGHKTELTKVTNTNGVTYNPLFVSRTNLRLTHRSPARKSDNLGKDLGALPYVKDQTSGLQGVVWASEKLTGAKSVIGDLIVAPGVTLTLNAGTTLTFAKSDTMAGGTKPKLPELVVKGTLNASGTATSRVKMTRYNTSSTWEGVRVESTGTASLSHTDIEYAERCVDSKGSVTLKNGTVSYCNYYGIYASGGKTDISYTRLLFNKRIAMGISSGTSQNTIHHNEFRGNCSTSTTSYGVQLAGLATFDHNTVAHNSTCKWALYLGGNKAIGVTNNIIANNGTYGIYAVSRSGLHSVKNNLVYKHTYSLGNVTSTNGLSVDPKFKSSTDVHLTSASPARGKATDGSDLGCYPFQTGTATKLTISPATGTVAANKTKAFSVQAYDSAGNPVSLNYTWSASAGGTISNVGVFTAGCKLGTFTNAVKVASGSLSATATVKVVAGAASKLVISPATASLAVRSNKTFTAKATDSCGNTVNLTGQRSWTTSSTSVGSITSAGVLTAGCNSGTYKGGVKLQIGSLSASADVQITQGSATKIAISPLNPTVQVGGRKQFLVTISDVCGHRLSSTGTRWAIKAGGGTIDQTGLFTAGNTPKTFTNTVQASLNALSKSTSVTVVAGKVSRVVVTPTTAKVMAGQTVKFSATAYDASGNKVTTPVSWTASAGGTIVASTGIFTAGTKAGPFHHAIKATAGGISAYATAHILPALASTVSVSPATVTIAPGGSTTFSAVVTDKYKNIRPDTVTWKALKTAAGSVDASGNFTAGKTVGSYSGAVQASVGAIRGTATVVIKSGALHHLKLTPNRATLKPSATVAFTVTGHDSSDNKVTIKPEWKVIQGGGTITAKGVFTAGKRSGTFKDTVQAKASGLSATATVVVESGSISSITITPDQVTIKPGAKQQFSASVKDAFGNALPISGLTWAADPGAGSITTKGLFTAGTSSGDWPTGVAAALGGVTANAGITIIGASSPDGGSAKDGGVVKKVDSGTIPPTSGEDDGCNLSGGASNGPALPSLFLLALLWRRQRRRTLD